MVGARGRMMRRLAEREGRALRQQLWVGRTTRRLVWPGQPGTGHADGGRGDGGMVGRRSMLGKRVAWASLSAGGWCISRRVGGSTHPAGDVDGRRRWAGSG